MNLVWYRNDLRVHAHRALQQALELGEPVLALYCLCEQQWDRHQVAPLRRWYVLQSLLELGDELAARGVDLHVLDAGDFAAVPGVLANFVTAHGIQRIFCSREYPLNELNRDREVARTLAPQGVEITGFDDSVLVPPRTLSTGKGTPYTVFSAYKKRWDLWLESHFQPVPALPGVASRRGAFVGKTVVEKALKKLNVADSLTCHWQPGEAAALQQLDHFAEQHLAETQEQCAKDRQRNESLSIDLASARDDLVEAEANCRSLQTALEEAEDDHSQRVEQLRKDLKQQCDVLQERDNTIASLDGQLATVKDEAETESQNHENERRDLLDLQRQRETEIGHLKLQIAGLRQLDACNDVTKSQIANRIAQDEETHQRELDRLQSQCQASKAQISEIELEVTRLKDAVESRDKTVAQLNDQLTLLSSSRLIDHL